MTEADWLIRNDDPWQMVQFLHRKASDRKLRLFACGYCRACQSLLSDPRVVSAIMTAEQYADDPATDDEFDKHFELWERGEAILGTDVWSREGFHAARNVAHEICTQTFDARKRTAVKEARERGLGGQDVAIYAHRAAVLARERTESAGSDLLRDIFGNPFRPATVDPALLAWNDSTIPKLAQAIYDERHLPSGHLDAGRLAILADALEDADCSNADMLSHCRSAGPHVRGCWVVDLLLGKE